MYCYLLTVESSSQSGTDLQVLPRVPALGLGKRAPGLMMPMSGDGLELRLPDGRVQHARVGSFGLELWRNEDGNLYTTSDPSNPLLTLTITGAHVEDVPPGTEVWLSEAKYQTPTETS